MLHGFDYHVDGSNSNADLVFRGGKLFGSMSNGGPTAAGDGTIYTLDLATDVLTTLYSIAGGTDGLFPVSGVVFDTNGLAYGATHQGGGSGAGTLFQINTKKLLFTTIHEFAISDGTQPGGPLLADGTGTLYGVTSGGGRGHGTIFKITP